MKRKGVDVVVSVARAVRVAKVRVTVTLDADVLEHVVERARLLERSVSWLVNNILKERLVCDEG